MDTLGSVSVAIEANIAPFRQGLDQASVAAKGFTDKARANLDQITPILQRMDATLTQIAANTMRAGGAFDQFGAQAAKAATAAQAAATASAKIGTSVQQAGTAASKSTGQVANDINNLRFQINDVATGLLSGGSPFMVLTQQAGQFSQILGGQGIRGAAAMLGQAFTSLLNPVNIAIAGIGIAAYAASSFFEDTEEGADTASAAIKRHDAVIRGLKDAYGEAAEGLDDYLKTGRLEADDKALREIRDLTIEVANGARAAAAAAREEIQSIFDPGLAFPEPLADMNAGPAPEAFERITQAAADLNASIEAGAPDVKSYVETLRSIANDTGVEPVVRAIARALIDQADAAADAQAKLEGLTGAHERLQRVYATGFMRDGAPEFRGPVMVGPEVQPRRPPNLLDFDPDKTADDKATRAIEREEEARRRLIAGMDARLERLRIEQAALGMTAEAAAAYRYEQEALIQAKQQGIQLSAEEVAHLHQTAQAMAAVEEATRQMREQQRETIRQMDDLRDTARDIFSGITQDILNGASAADILTNALGKIADKLISIGMDGMIEDLFGKDGTAETGAIGGFFKELFGIGSSQSSNATKPANDNAAGAFSGLRAIANPFSSIGSGNVAAKASGTGVDAQVWNFFAGKGLQPHQIAGIMGNVGAESGFNPSAIGDGGLAFGLFQHHAARGGGTGLLGDVQGQLELTWKELMGSESKAMQALLASKDVRSATAAFGGFERPAGFSWSNPEGMHNWSGRLEGAEAALAKFGETTKTATGSLGELTSGAKETVSAIAGDGKGGGGLFGSLFGGGEGGEGEGVGLFGGIGKLLDGITGQIGKILSSLFGDIGSFLSPLLGLFGFADGGYTGNGATGAPAGIVHGQEYVMDAEATRRIGLANLDAMRAGKIRGLAQPMGQAANQNGIDIARLEAAIKSQKLSPTVVFVDDPKRVGDYIGTDEGTQTIVTRLRRAGAIN